MKNVDPEYMKWASQVEALPESKKAEIRESLLAEAGISRKKAAPKTVPNKVSDALGE